ncbi:MAG: hypothetical protein M3P30_10195 [Chloroflexota bacterium]|nr:hypothetical protein [Chloroflexota bacterium]
MRPYPEEILRAIQSGIVAHFAPELTSNYARAQFAFSMLLFGIATRDFDSAVPDLVEANRALRSLLVDAGTVLTAIQRDGATAARSAIDELPPPADSLLVSALRAENDVLRSAVSQLAPLLEAAADDPGLAALAPSRTAIFTYLSADARKRMVPILTAG